MIARYLLTAALAVLLCAAGSPLAAAAQQLDVIRGRVTAPDGAAVENAVVTVTSIPGNVSRTARTDRDGRFTVTFPGGEGDYIVSFAAIGYQGRQFEIKRIADEDILIADARLSPILILDAVAVTAPRERVPRNEVTPDVGGTEQALVNDAVPANLMGDLAAMAATLPGIMSVPGGGEDGADGFSVFGLGSDQNNATLNGMSFGGSGLPRDAGVSSSLATSPYDVSRGGFSGAQVTLRTRPGSNFITRGMSLLADAPQMQWSDDAARALGQEYSNVSLGGLHSGPIQFNRSFYNLSWQLGRRSNLLQTLLNTDPVGLREAGVAADSVARLVSILGGAGVPLSVGGLGSHRYADQGSVFGSVDFAPRTSASGQAVNLTFTGNWNRLYPTGLAPTQFASSGGERTAWRGGVQARHNSYVRNVILSETSVGMSASGSESQPFLEMPAGVVRISSTFEDGSAGVRTVPFGGSPSLSSSQSGNSLGFLNQLSWFSRDNKHRLKLTTELRRDGSTQEQAPNGFGTFTFNSLADLEAGAPSSFTRQLSPRRRDVSQLIGSVSLGDSYRPSQNLQIQYGVRLDANRFLTEPGFNPVLESEFGVRNDRLPNGTYVSPRAGFSWSYGTAPQVAGFEGAARQPRATVRGGLGLFQNIPSNSILGPAIDNTGLPGGAQQVTCVGAATPIPDWIAYATQPGLVPDRCADGTMGTPFASTAPNVMLFARDYSPQRSLRSNLQWSGPTVGNRFSTELDVSYSLNLNQPGLIDLNFNPEQRFALAGEGGRPVFVEPGSIVPSTGAIAAGGARLSDEFSRVTQFTSDLRSRSAQFRARVSPAIPSSGFNWNLAYVYTDVREESRGFVSTAGNPLQIEWARSPMAARHQIVYNAGYNFFDFVRVNWFGSLRSGVPFTPMVAGDVNGDGYANDRAFVFDPAAAPDPELAAGMQALLESGSGAARRCLARQLGQLAGRHSCQGPWTSTASLSVSFNPARVRMPQRAALSFQLSNPLGAADLLLHGSKGLRGWGHPFIPDQSLLHVRGFDPRDGRFTYEVNQRFGANNQGVGGMGGGGAFRVPVTLTAMLRFDIGPTRERQLLTQQLDRGRTRDGERVPEMMLRAMYGSAGIPNPMAAILRQQDSLGLSGIQADSIATLNRRYMVATDSIWSPVVSHLAALPDTYDRDAAYRRYVQARKATVDLLIQLAPAIQELLTAEQKRKLPPVISRHLDVRYLATVRSGTGTFAGSSPFTGGGAVPFAGGVVMPAGAGGGGISIIRQ